MPNNTLDDLRNHLFATLEELRDTHPDRPIDAEQMRLKIEKAKSIREISRTIIDAAKVEVEYADVTGQIPDTNFFPPPSERTKNDRLLTGYRANGKDHTA